MPKLSKSRLLTTGIALMAIGAGLVVWGYQKSGGFSSKLSGVFTGSPSNDVMVLYIGGAACFIVGVYLSIKK